MVWCVCDVSVGGVVCVDVSVCGMVCVVWCV